MLAARSGILKLDQARDLIAHDAASMDAEVGRSWRPLQDTTNEVLDRFKDTLPKQEEMAMVPERSVMQERRAA